MKNLYTNPEIKINNFNVESIVTESGLTAAEMAEQSLNSQKEKLGLTDVLIVY